MVALRASPRILRAKLCIALAVVGGVLTAPGIAAAVPLHTETWAYDDSAQAGTCNGGFGASPATVRRWVTYAETNCGPWSLEEPKAIGDCHSGGVTYCQVIPYVDTDLIYPHSAPSGLVAAASGQSSWFLHEPAPNESRPVTTHSDGGGYLMDQDTGGYQVWWRNYVNSSFPGADGLFMDDQSPYMPFYGLSATSSAEITTAAALQAEHAAMSLALQRTTGAPYPQVDNTIPDCGNPNENEQGIGPTGNMLAWPVVGLVAEGCPERDGRLTPWYPDLLDDMAYVTNSTRGFTTLLPYGSAGTPYAAQSRRVNEATVLLGYAPGRVVDWPELETNSRDLSIWPEEGIYPVNPVQSMTSPSGSGCLTDSSGVACPTGGHNDLEVQPGVYRREFHGCYNQGELFGSCAAIVNDTANPVLVQTGWLRQEYQWQITTNVPYGTTGDVQSGATISVEGAPFTAGLTTIGPSDALLLTGPTPPTPSPVAASQSSSVHGEIADDWTRGLLWQLR